MGLLATPATPAAPSVRVEAWPDETFPEFALRTPERAAALLLAAGGVGDRKPLPADFDTAAFGTSVASRLAGVVARTGDEEISIIVAASDRKGVLAVAQGRSLLLVMPTDGSVARESLTSSAAEALVAASLPMAPPSPTLGEPLLALSEALSRSGALALASLPPELRPVSDWLEPGPARTTLESFAREMLDKDIPWSARQARLTITGKPGGASPALAQAAADVLECLGTPAELAAHPEVFLDVWSTHDDPRCPAMPRVLRRALADPKQAGQPPEDKRSEVDAVAAAAMERAVQVGPLDPLPGSQLSTAQRLHIAARSRAAGAPGLCAWLTGAALPPSALTGCREEEPRAGFLLARPRPATGFEVVWRSTAGVEHPILIWPRWVRSPVLWPEATSLAFVDPHGIWVVALDGRSAPASLVAGGFRSLAASPDGRMLAAARWPEPETWLLSGHGDAIRLPASGNAGVAWLENEVVAVASGEHIGLFSREGEGRPKALAAPCTTAMTARAGKLYLADGTPCDGAVWRMDPSTGQRERLLTPPAPVAALRVTSEGVVLMATAGGLWRWQPGGAPERFSDGLTIGP